MVLFTHQASDLFNYDQAACANQILLAGPEAASLVEYDEYVVYRKSQTEIADDASNHEETHVTHRFSQDDKSGATMLDLAFRQNHSLSRTVKKSLLSARWVLERSNVDHDIQGEFEPSSEEDPVVGLEGRVRRVYVLQI